MTDAIATEGTSHGAFNQQLDRLHLLLHSLPTQLPDFDSRTSCYAPFLDFSLSADLIEKTGSETSALSEQLKEVFGWQTQSSGDDSIVSILECSKGICALHSVLTTFSQRYPKDAILNKWIDDIIAGAEKVFGTYDIPVREPRIPRRPSL